MVIPLRAISHPPAGQADSSLKLGLIACLIPYVYFSFQVGTLCF